MSGGFESESYDIEPVTVDGVEWNAVYIEYDGRPYLGHVSRSYRLVEGSAATDWYVEPLIDGSGNAVPAPENWHSLVIKRLE